MAALQGQAILVTGGGRGLGAAICETLSKDGADVFVADRDAGRAESCAARLKGLSLSAEAIVLDVASVDEVSRALTAFCRRTCADRS